MSATNGGTRTIPRGALIVMAVAAVLYGVCILVVLGGTFVVVNAMEDTCAYRLDGWGQAGEPSWSWLPTGQTCTYEYEVVGPYGGTERLTHVDPPSPFVTTTLVLLVVAPLGAVAAWRLGRRT